MSVYLANAGHPFHQRNSRNRFLPLDHGLSPLAFPCLREVQLNSTLISWAEFRDVAQFMPNLQSVELGFNHLKSLGLPSPSVLPELSSLNFEGNLLDDWVQMAGSLRNLITYDLNNFAGMISDTLSACND